MWVTRENPGVAPAGGKEIDYEFKRRYEFLERPAFGEDVRAINASLQF